MPLKETAPSATLVQQRPVAPPGSPTPEYYRIQFTASAETHAKLRRAQDLLRHQIPDGDPSAVIDRALAVLIAQLEKSKTGRVDRPRREPPHAVTPSGATPDRRPGSRHISAAVRRAVWQRDDCRCAFIGRDGRRCDERGFLEFHHVKPFAAGGAASVENIELRCRAHNQYEADLYFAGGPASSPSGVRECVAEYFVEASWLPTGSGPRWPSSGGFRPHRVRPRLVHQHASSLEDCVPHGLREFSGLRVLPARVERCQHHERVAAG